jgi:Cation transporter/ATPase, N-terminus
VQPTDVAQQLRTESLVPPCDAAMDFAWTRQIQDIARELDVDIHTGLSDKKAALAIQHYGKNGTVLSPTAPVARDAVHFRDFC